MIRQLVTVFATLLSLVAPAPAQTPPQAPAESCGTRDLIAELSPADRAKLDALVAKQPFAEGNFWRAEKPGSTVYVAGTLHIPDPRLAGFYTRISPYIPKADLVILEADADTQAATQKLATDHPEYFFIQSGPSIIDLLGPEDWAIAKARLDELGFPTFVAAKFQPWYLSIIVGIPGCAFKLMRQGVGGLDKMIEEEAKKDNVPIATLDSADVVVKIFGNDPIDKQLQALRLILHTTEDGDASISTLLAGYFDERVRETWEFNRIQGEMLGLEGSDEMFDELNKSVLLDRNQFWEPKIVKLVAGKTAVLAVGGAHLSGETGVLRSLQRAGYTITRM